MTSSISSTAPHENFNIEPPQRLEIIRQDRADINSDNCFIEVNGIKYELLNYSPFGIAVKAADINTTDHLAEIFNVPLIFENVEIARVHCKLIRKDSLGDGSAKMGFEIIGEPINVEKIEAVRFSQNIIKEQNLHFSAWTHVPDQFKKAVYEMKDWLSEFESKLNESYSKIPKRNNKELIDFEDTVAHVMGKYFSENFPPQYEILAKILKTCNELQVQSSFDFFRHQLLSLIYQAPFANRVFYKPLGYAGDFEMMNIIYNGESFGEGLFAKCLHKYFVDEPAAKAVRNRSEYLVKKITESLTIKTSQNKIKFMSVASGPAMEIQKLIKSQHYYAEPLPEFHFLDQDIESLKHAQRKLIELSREYKKPYEFKFIHKALKNVLNEGLGERDYDIIYSAGLFDYFSDPVAQRAAQKLVESLKKGGQLIIGNFSFENPNQFTMDIALDWKLIYRSDDDLHRLFGKLGTSFTIEKESLGINLFCVITK